jgi:hypothetical protein
MPQLLLLVLRNKNLDLDTSLSNLYVACDYCSQGNS